MAAAHRPIARRVFMRQASAGAAFLALHESLGRAPPDPSPQGAPGPDTAKGDPLIRALRLLTPAPLERMRAFYEGGMGFRVTAEKHDEITFGAGGTALTFALAGPDQRGAGERAGPLYHVAFNVPRNALRGARAWQLQRSALVPPRPALVDPAYPDDVWHFRHWNAHSVFFFDPAYNILEYIARHDLADDSPDPDRFGTADIRYASEIGFVVDPLETSDEQARAAGMLRNRLGLHEYPRGATPWALGDERGLLLLLARKGHAWGANTPTPVTWGVFPTDVTVRGAAPGSFEFDGLPYRVRIES